MRIAEIFYSIQGEGKLAGVPSVFVRASGCNLRCSWCDTPYASWRPEGEEQGIEQIVQKIREYPAQHVVLTGGEPLIMPEVERLCSALKGGGCHLTVETAGTVYKPLSLDLASVSPKLSNSTPTEMEGGRYAAAHERNRLNVEAIQAFIDHSPEYQLKFVVSREEDLAEIDAILARLREVKREDVLLMPEGTNAGVLAERAPWVVEMCKARGFRYCPRLHVEMWGNRRKF